MTNRVTDQTTQNGLIEKFQLKGLLPEMTVVPTIIPVVQVASLEDTLNIGAFEKWRSVFSVQTPLVDAANVAFVSEGFPQLARYNVYAQNSVTTSFTNQLVSGNFGVALPGAGVGVPATDGIYLAQLEGFMPVGSQLYGWVQLRDMDAFGQDVAAGALRATIGVWNTLAAHAGTSFVWRSFLKIALTDDVNAINFVASAGSSGSGSFNLRVIKLIDELPENVIFP